MSTVLDGIIPESRENQNFCAISFMKFIYDIIIIYSSILATSKLCTNILNMLKDIYYKLQNISMLF